MKIIKFSLYLLIASFLSFHLYRFCHDQTDGFSVSKIRPAFTDQAIEHVSSAESDLSIQEVQGILCQPLKYLGRGGQCYAFSTQDGQYVVKLLKYNNNYPRIWFRLIPFPWGLEKYRQEKIAKKRQKLAGEYLSYRIALENLSNETGIIFFHLDAGSLPNIQLEIYDKINVRHTLSADQFQFYIQKKGTPFYPEIKKMIEEGSLEKAKQALDEMSVYLLKRCQKKITDKDSGVWRNFAFHKGHPFQIDIGQFIYDPSLFSEKNYKDNLLFFTREFRQWLQQVSPPLEEHFTQSICSLENAHD